MSGNSTPTIIKGGNSLLDGHDGNIIVGKQVTFDNKGARYIVDKIEELPKAQYKPRGLILCWERREDGRIVERRVTQPDQPHPKRDSLGYLNEEEWPISKYTGKPEDVWQDSRYLYFLNPQTCVDYTLVTRTKGGRVAISDLKRTLQNFADEYPDAGIPLIEFDHVMWWTRYGDQPRPEIRVIVPPAQISERPVKQIEHVEGRDKATTKRGVNKITTTTAEVEEPSSGKPFDDKIGF